MGDSLVFLVLNETDFFILKVKILWKSCRNYPRGTFQDNKDKRAKFNTWSSVESRLRKAELDRETSTLLTDFISRGEYRIFYHWTREKLFQVIFEKSTASVHLIRLVQIHYWCTALMWKIVKMPIADWLPYHRPLYINVGFGLRKVTL